MATESEPLLNGRRSPQIQLHQGLNSRYSESNIDGNISPNVALLSHHSQTLNILGHFSSFLRLLIISFFLIELSLSLPFVFLPAKVLLHNTLLVIVIFYTS